MSNYDLLRYHTDVDGFSCILLPPPPSQRWLDCSRIRMTTIIEKGKKIAWLNDIYTFTRHSGVGTVLLNAAIRWAIKSNLYIIKADLVTTEDEYHNTKTWYQNLGFDVSSRNNLMGNTYNIQLKTEKILHNYDIHYHVYE